ncbi:GNAT family N-acetyltransferase [Pedobacter frigidisoli]|uniref:GNAT family N-acetyltransferase n=1 Tax=Pedobacter frigidisoli TaxID=2530455 RepID=A0A4R0P2F6_9SPHI|nr:GNAT family N-acetyltransferase [Pedobacter frigidisoli]TCD10717.1 GNAT family N-acetyltransferase [Pedobacter frigidisoli]
MKIRLAVEADIPKIMQLVKKVVPLMQAAGNFQWGNDYPNPGVFAEDIEIGQLWVAEINGDVAGVSAITKDQDPEYADAGWEINDEAIVTHRLAVDPDCRGMGIARALMEQAEIVAKNKGIKILRVDTNSENLATRALFPKLGYEFSGEIGLAKRPGLRFYCYEKLL